MQSLSLPAHVHTHTHTQWTVTSYTYTLLELDVLLTIALCIPVISLVSQHRASLTALLCDESDNSREVTEGQHHYK